MQSEVILWAFAIKSADGEWSAEWYRSEQRAALARSAMKVAGHECGPLTRLVLPLPTDYPEPSRG